MFVEFPELLATIYLVEQLYCNGLVGLGFRNVPPELGLFIGIIWGEQHGEVPGLCMVKASMCRIV